MDKKSILIITQYFYPENFRINDLALELQKQGYQVTVLTGLPNYPQGEYYEGYNRNKNCDEIWQGIQIYRCNMRARYSGSINLIRNYISFVYQANRKLKQIQNQQFDLIYVFEVSPITVALPAIRLKKKKKIPIIMNVQDLWPENIIAVTGLKNKFIIIMINRIVNYIYKNCDVILAASPSFVLKIQERVKNKSKVKYWPQYSIVSQSKESNNLYNKNNFNIVFTGNIGDAQGIDLAIEVAQELKNKKICWHFIGNGRKKQELEERVKKYKLKDKVIFYGQVPEEEIPLYLKDADVALLILNPNSVFEMTIPAKLQTYLSCGVPILGCVSGEGKKIIEESKAGVVSNEISKKSLMYACNEILGYSIEELDILRKNALNYGKIHFDKDKVINQLIQEMEGLL